MSSDTKTKTKRYRIGIKSENDEGIPAPCHYVTIAGIRFPRYTEKVTGFGSETKRERIEGSYIHLTEEQIQSVHDKLPDLVVRFAGKDTQTGAPLVTVDDSVDPPVRLVRARVYNRSAKGFFDLPGDTSLEGWIYIQEHDGPTEFDNFNPPSLLSARGRQPAGVGSGGKHSKR